MSCYHGCDAKALSPGNIILILLSMVKVDWEVLRLQMHLHYCVPIRRQKNKSKLEKGLKDEISKGHRFG